MRLDHVQVAAPPGCEERARAFYGGLLGLPEVDEAGADARERRRLVRARRPAAARRRRGPVRAGDEGAPGAVGRRRPSCDALAARRSRPPARRSRGTTGCPGSGASTPRTLRQPDRATCRAPQARTPSGPSGEVSCAGGGPTCGSGRMSLATTCVTGAPVSRATRPGRSPWIQRELWPGSVETITSSWRRGSQVSATASIGLASPQMPSASMPASRHRRARRRAGSARPRAPEPGPWRGHQQRHVDRALLGALADRVDQVTRAGGDVGEDEHVCGHRRLLRERVAATVLPSQERAMRVTSGRERQLDDLGGGAAVADRERRRRARPRGARSRARSARGRGRRRRVPTRPTSFSPSRSARARRDRRAEPQPAQVAVRLAAVVAAARPSPGRRSSPS